jgi:hypothetical protein
MPAKDNEKARDTRAKTTAESLSDTTTPAEAAKSPAGSRRKSTASAPADVGILSADIAIDAPKRRRSVRRTEAVTAASSEAAPSSATSSPESGAAIESSSSSNTTFQEQVRLRAYLLNAERGYRSESPESDWFQAEREVAYGRQI